MNIPWGTILASIAIAAFWRPIFPPPQDAKYFGVCLISACVLGLVSVMLEVKNERK